MAANLNNLNYTLNGLPFYKIVAKVTIDVSQLNYTLNGFPWYGMGGAAQPLMDTGNIKRILKVDWQHAQTVINVEG
jgi:hypothetical protein